MILDTIEAFEALKRYGIHTARSKFVDSAEDAIVFAERRTAADPRFLPIVLRNVVPEIPAQAKPAPSTSALSGEDAVRRAYAFLAGDGLKVLAQTSTAPGTDLTIVGGIPPDRGKTIALHTPTHSVERMVPLDSAGAEILASNFLDHHHHGSSEQVRRMLEHLLLRLSTFFEDSGVDQFQLVVRLHENTYTVLDAAMRAPKALHLKTRLDARAHDRWGDDYHPAGRQ
jgi:hypothetical protein